jgi:hypothetical protein
MGDRGADDPASTTWRAQAFVNVREVLNGIFYILWTGCLEGAAEGPAAKEHGARRSSLTTANWPGLRLAVL